MSKEFKIGLLALIASAMLYTGFNFLKGSDFLSADNRYYAIYDNVNGLTVSNPVMVNGLTVGKVANIAILQKQNNRLLVALDIRKDLKLGENTKAILGDNGLLGGKMIELKVGKINQVLDNNDTLKAEAQPGMVAELTEKADPLLAKADSILDNIKKITQTFADSRGEIDTMMRNFKQISTSLNQTLAKGQVDAILANSNQLLRNLNALQAKFQPLPDKMGAFTDKLNALELEATVQKSKDAMDNLNQLLAKINEGEGSLGALMNDKALYENLNNVSANLDQVLIDLRENPKRYVNFSVFGRKDKEDE